MEQTTIPFEIGADHKGARLDLFLSEQIGELTRSHVQKLLADGFVLVNGAPVNKNYKLRVGDTVELTMPEPEPCRAEPEDIPIDIVYEDDDIIVVNKPKGMVVHPAAGNYTGTLVSALLYHCGERLSGIGGVIRPGIVHRIDKDTSGLLVVAKNDAAHLFLSDEIKEHKVSRVYHAIVLGKLDEPFTVDLPIGRHPVDRKKMAVTEKNSKNAVTHVSILGRYTGATHIRCELETGRTHQIRVHLSHKNHPLLGDLVYGAAKHPMNQKYAKYTDGQCLHAAELHLTHPRTGEPMHFEAPLPEYFTKVLDLLQKAEKGGNDSE
ncbi:MAG: RluA family pseudouridine synthase [Clostridia bacterium]|nr:RluA family pseudouridine synthase [Clostridia bacterium]